MNKLTFNRNFVLLAVSSFVMILLIALCILRVRNLNETKELIAIETQALKVRQERLSGLKALERIRPQLEYAFDALEGKIPQLPMEHALVNAIQEMTSNHNADLIQLQFDERVTNQDLLEMPLTFSISAKYSSLVSLLDTLATGDRLIRIDEIHISKDETAINSIRADFSAVAFSNDNEK